MRHTLAIARKELGIYFTTPWAYVVFTAMIALSAFFFVAFLMQFNLVQEYAKGKSWAHMPSDWQMYRNLTEGVIVPLWGLVLGVTLFVAPFLSMRLFAEEKRHKTLELLMTAPVRPIEIVLGKYLGGLGIISVTLGLTIAFPALLSILGGSTSTLEWSTVLLGYAGLLLGGACCIGIGMAISSFTESQMLAAFLTFAVLIPWWFLSNLAQFADEPIRSVLSYMSFDKQLQGFLQGMLDIRSLVFAFSVIVFSLFLTHRSVEAQRWI